MQPVTYSDQWGNLLTPDQVPMETIHGYIAAYPGADPTALIPITILLLIPVVYALWALVVGYYEPEGEMI